METGRIFLRGEPPFRETCDMLCPDALGAVPVNQAIGGGLWGVLGVVGVFLSGVFDGF